MTSAAQELARELRPPAGFDIQDVTEGGRYVTLQNGTAWEVEISDRATTAPWERATSWASVGSGPRGMATTGC